MERRGSVHYCGPSVDEAGTSQVSAPLTTRTVYSMMMLVINTVFE